MKYVYTLVREADTLDGKGKVAEYFELLLKQTIECGYFVEAYARDDFGKQQTLSRCRLTKTVVRHENYQGTIQKFRQNHRRYYGEFFQAEIELPKSRYCRYRYPDVQYERRDKKSR